MNFIPKRHWTPRYIWSWAKLGVYQRNHADHPWLTPLANQILEGVLLPTDIGLEWGSGRSTLWFARHLKHLTSVEHDKAWHAKIHQKIKERQLPVDYVLCDEQPTADPAASPYVGVADRFQDYSLDFVLVDGAFREHCALRATDKIKPGGLLVIDNANNYFDYPTRSPFSQTGKGPLNPVWAEVWDCLRHWRLIWTTQGVTDTAIWFRPSE